MYITPGCPGVRRLLSPRRRLVRGPFLTWLILEASHAAVPSHTNTHWNTHIRSVGLRFRGNAWTLMKMKRLSVLWRYLNLPLCFSHSLSLSLSLSLLSPLSLSPSFYLSLFPSLSLPPPQPGQRQQDPTCCLSSHGGKLRAPLKMQLFFLYTKILCSRKLLWCAVLFITCVACPTFHFQAQEKSYLLKI